MPPTAEVVLTPTVMTGITPLFILQAGIAGLLLAMVLIHLWPKISQYTPQAKTTLEAAENVRHALEVVIPNLKTIPWFERWVFIENNLKKIVVAAEHLKGKENDKQLREDYAISLLCTTFGISEAEVRANPEKMAVVRSAISMGVAGAGLVGKASVGSLPFRSGDPVS